MNYKLIVGGVVIFALGALAGREHVKYEIRKTMQEAFTGVTSAIATSRPVVKPETSPEKIEPTFSVALLEKGSVEKNLEKHVYEDLVTFTLQFQNLTGQNIRAFDGKVVFTDLLGNQVSNLRVEINDSVAVGGSMKWRGAIKFNQFQEAHKRLKAEPVDSLKVSFVPGKILFVDGQIKEY